MRIQASLVLLGSLAATALTSNSPSAQSRGFAVPLSDPSRPALVKVSALNAAIVVRGTARRDVLFVEAGDRDDSREAQSAARRGLRRLTQNGGVSVTEENNEVTVNMLNKGGDEGRIEFEVPAKTNLKIAASHGDEIRVENLDGEIEVMSHNGDIDLVNVAGAVVVSTQNGDVKVVLTRITSDKPMAFTSFNGDVDVTLPATTRARLRMRSDNGDILTDFDVAVQTEPPPTPVRTGGKLKVELNPSVTGLINGGGPLFELRSFNGDIFLRKLQR